MKLTIKKVGEVVAVDLKGTLQDLAELSGQDLAELLGLFMTDPEKELARACADRIGSGAGFSISGDLMFFKFDGSPTELVEFAKRMEMNLLDEAKKKEEPKKEKTEKKAPYAKVKPF